MYILIYFFYFADKLESNNLFQPYQKFAVTQTMIHPYFLILFNINPSLIPSK